MYEIPSSHETLYKKEGHLGKYIENLEALKNRNQELIYQNFVSKIMNLSIGGRTPANNGRLSNAMLRQSIKRFSNLNRFASGKNFSSWLDN
jgi:hypothetical protein